MDHYLSSIASMLHAWLSQGKGSRMEREAMHLSWESAIRQDQEEARRRTTSPDEARAVLQQMSLAFGIPYSDE